MGHHRDVVATFPTNGWIAEKNVHRCTSACIKEHVRKTEKCIKSSWLFGRSIQEAIITRFRSTICLSVGDCRGSAFPGHRGSWDVAQNTVGLKVDDENKMRNYWIYSYCPTRIVSRVNLVHRPPATLGDHDIWSSSSAQFVSVSVKIWLVQSGWSTLFWHTLHCVYLAYPVKFTDIVG